MNIQYNGGLVSSFARQNIPIRVVVQSKRDLNLKWFNSPTLWVGKKIKVPLSTK